MMIAPAGDKSPFGSLLFAKTWAGAIAFPIAAIPDAASNTFTLHPNRMAATDLFACAEVVISNSYGTVFWVARVSV